MLFSYLDGRMKRFSIGNHQIKGERAGQEDSFGTIVKKEFILGVVADGMGGIENGKEASKKAVQKILSFSNQYKKYKTPEDFLKDSFSECNKEVLNNLKKGGTTLVAALIDKMDLYWCSIGDSAIYLYRNKELIRLNNNHNLKNLLEKKYQNGQISKREAIAGRKKQALTSFIGHGGFKEVELNQTPLKLKRKDKILICTDGVYNSLSEIEIEQILSRRSKAQDMAEYIIDKVEEKRKKNQDNATILLFEKNF